MSITSGVRVIFSLLTRRLGVSFIISVFLGIEDTRLKWFL